jgi:hypothetical protein
MKKFDKFAMIASLVFIVTYIMQTHIFMIMKYIFKDMPWSYAGTAFTAFSIMAVYLAVNFVIAIWLYIQVKKEDSLPWLWFFMSLVFGIEAPLLFYAIRIYKKLEDGKILSGGSITGVLREKNSNWFRSVEILAIVALILFVISFALQIYSVTMISMIEDFSSAGTENLALYSTIKSGMEIGSKYIVQTGIAVWLFIIARRDGMTPWVWALFGLTFGLTAPILYYCMKFYESAGHSNLLANELPVADAD